MLYYLCLMSEEFSKKYFEAEFNHLSTGKLFEIIDNKLEYTEIALNVAIAELAKRKITKDDIEAYRTKIENDLKNDVNVNINYTLTILQKLFFYFLWLPIFTIALKQNFVEDGYVLKLKQARYYSTFGCVSLILWSLIQVKLGGEDFAFLIMWGLSFIIAYLFDEFYNRKAMTRKLKEELNIQDTLITYSEQKS
jgi:hypothetical protein